MTAFNKAWGVVKNEGFDEDIARLEREMDSMPADMCQICRADLNEKKNLSANQHRMMMETGAFPDVCIKCQKEYGLSGDF